MARPTRRSPSPTAADAGGSKRPRVLRRRPTGAAANRGGEPAIANDLVDVEAPSLGGAAVDTAAYAAPAEGAGTRASADDLIDVEAPPVGGAAVDTAAYAAPGAKPRRSARTRTAVAPEAIDARGPPPPADSGADAEGVDPLDGEAGSAPPPAGPELGGDPPAGGAPALAGPDGDLLQRAGLAALRLAADRPWPQVSLRDVAQEAGVPFAALYARASGKPALLLALSARLDRAALERIADDTQPAARDRLFEAVMSRLEVMAPHRDALLAIGRSERASPTLAAALPRTARALLEGAGVDAAGVRGALRLAAVTGVWARTLQVWRDDEGALNRTMAEIDKLLTRADGRLSRVGAGF